MKKLMVCLCLIEGIFLVISCASSKTADSDFESSNKTTAEKNVDLDNADDSGEINTDFDIQINSKQVIGTSYQFVEYDGTEIAAPNVVGKLKSANAVMVYVPKSNSFGFGSNYLAAYYYLHLDNEGREALAKAAKEYLQDFDGKRLQRTNSNKTTKIYGNTNAYLNWGTIKSECPNNGEGSLYFGYKFVDRSPYFTLSISNVYNKRSKDVDTAPKESMNLIYYFNKSSLKKLTDDLSDVAVKAVLGEYNRRTYGLDYSEDNTLEEDEY